MDTYVLPWMNWVFEFELVFVFVCSHYQPCLIWCIQLTVGTKWTESGWDRSIGGCTVVHSWNANGSVVHLALTLTVCLCVCFNVCVLVWLVECMQLGLKVNSTTLLYYLLYLEVMCRRVSSINCRVYVIIVASTAEYIQPENLYISNPTH